MATLLVGDKQFSRHSAEFATVLYQKNIEGRDNENVIFSPFSIQTALGLAYMGSNGVTAEEMVNGIRLNSKNKTTVSENFQQLLVIQNNNPDISIANKIYVNANYKMKREFEEIAINQFKSETENLRFSQNKESAAIINNWAENKTNQRIKELISEDMLNDATAMILVNAIYFQGSWKNKFKERYTYPQKFWTSKTESSEIDMMTISLTIPTNYSEILRATAIQLPYKSLGMYMMIILPDERDGLQHLERNLNQINLMDFAATMKDKQIDYITIPKFKIDFSVELTDPLKKMGMKTMFSGGADFSGMLETSQPIQISNAIHKAFIDVNEEGTEAGAATAIIMHTNSVYNNASMYFTADHPFFYAIMNEHGVLFAGRFVKNSVL